MSILTYIILSTNCITKVKLPRLIDSSNSTMRLQPLWRRKSILQNSKIFIAQELLNQRTGTEIINEPIPIMCINQHPNVTDRVVIRKMVNIVLVVRFHFDKGIPNNSSTTYRSDNIYPLHNFWGKYYFSLKVIKLIASAKRLELPIFCMKDSLQLLVNKADKKLAKVRCLGNNLWHRKNNDNEIQLQIGFGPRVLFLILSSRQITSVKPAWISSRDRFKAFFCAPCLCNLFTVCFVC